MNRSSTPVPPSARSTRITTVLGVLVVLTPVLLFRSLQQPIRPGEPLSTDRPQASFASSPLKFESLSIDDAGGQPGRVCHVQVVDLDQDGRNDILACDARLGSVVWYRTTGPRTWTATNLNQDRLLAAPAHASVVDLDGDGDRDVVVAVLGKVWPTNEHIGAVAWLENNGQHQFKTHVVLDDLRRVADVQPGDFDQDGDIDLAVAVFGYDQGQILWLENQGQGQFLDHELMEVPGTIHVPVGDFDGDGDLDFVAAVSQDEEEIIAFENQGEGQDAARFVPRRLHVTWNFDLGTSGLVATDLDQDGDLDFLLTAGDNLELLHNYPQPWHGCFWLENQGAWKFASRRIASVGGAYAAAPGDLDGDGDLDVVLVSQFNDWTQPNAASVLWLENDGQQKFSTWQIADRPIRLATVACGDLDGDGRVEIVGGSFHLMQPFDRLGSVTAWFQPTQGAP